MGLARAGPGAAAGRDRVRGTEGGTGRPIPARTLDAVHLTFLLGWFATLFVWTRWPEPVLPGRPLRRVLAFAAVLYAASLAGSARSRQAVSVLLGPAQAYARAMSDRHERLAAAAAAGEPTAVVPPLPAEPEFYVVPELDHYRDLHLRDYYGLRQVVVGLPPAPDGVEDGREPTRPPGD